MDKNNFKSSSNPYLANNTRFNPKQNKLKTTLYVEGYDDLVVYGKTDIGNYYNITIAGNRENVLKSVQIDNKARGIVDSDYEINTNMNRDITLTTGYSMENFFFYKTPSINNLESLLSNLTTQVNKDKLINEILDSLNSFINRYIIYFAYCKSQTELGYRWNTNITEAVNNGSNNVNRLIENEINSLNPKPSRVLRTKIIQNKAIILSKGFMMIRGHNIFDFLLNDLKINPMIYKHNLRKKDIYNLVNKISFPDSFLLSLGINKDNSKYKIQD